MNTANTTPHADHAVHPPTAAEVRKAADRLAGLVSPTPITPSDRLSKTSGCQVFLKREDLQTVRSYKTRGATNLIAQLSPEARSRGVVCASAGNHAQGVARACTLLGVHSRIYLPSNTPRQKVHRVAELGEDWVDIIIGGTTYDDAAEAAFLDAEESGSVLVPAFDDPRTIAGQGTVAVETIEQLTAQGLSPDVVLVPVGGGGLLAGMLLHLRAAAPKARIIGVEPSGAASMQAALKHGGPIHIDVTDAFVDGAAVGTVGSWTYPIIRDNLVEIISVPEGQVCSEMLALYQTDGIIAEPAGALASAALRSLDLPADSVVLAVVSGGNNDVSRYAETLERSLVFEGRKHYFLVDFPQEPGALRRFLDEVLGPDDDVVLFEYVKRNNREIGPALVGIELGNPDSLPDLLARMAAAPPRIERLDTESPLFRFLV